ncbi:hypothetical protein Tco_1386811 [Tanacetum coccineum]
MTTLTPCPKQNVVLHREDRFVTTRVNFLFSPLLEEYYNPAHGHAEENNNDQAPNASFQENEFINPFCTREELHQSTDTKSGTSRKPFAIYYKAKVVIEEQEDEEQTEISHKARLTSDPPSPKGILSIRRSVSVRNSEKALMDNCHSIGTPYGYKTKLNVDLSGTRRTICIIEPRGRARALSASCAQVNVDEDTTSRLWLQLQQNTVVLRLSIGHSNLMQPSTTFANKAHPYSVQTVVTATSIHANAQSYETYYLESSSLKTKTSANSDLKLSRKCKSMSMLVKDKRSQDGKDEKDNDKGSKSRSQSMKEQAYNK